MSHNYEKQLFSLPFQQQLTFAAICCRKEIPYFEHYLKGSRSINKDFSLRKLVLDIIKANVSKKEYVRPRLRDYIEIPEMASEDLLEKIAYTTYEAIEGFYKFSTSKDTEYLDAIFEVIDHSLFLYLDSGLETYLEESMEKIRKKISMEFDIKKEHYSYIEELWAHYPYYFVEQHLYRKRERSFREDLIKKITKEDLKGDALITFVDQFECSLVIDIKKNSTYMDKITQDYPNLTENFMDYFRENMKAKLKSSL